jgi:hypothetical protein
MQGQRRSRGIAPVIHKLGGIIGWVFNATLRPLYPRERPATHSIGCWVCLGAVLAGCLKSRPPTKFRTRDPPAPGESLYSLHYPDRVLYLQYDCLRGEIFGLTGVQKWHLYFRWFVHVALTSAPKLYALFKRRLTTPQIWPHIRFMLIYRTRWMSPLWWWGRELSVCCEHGDQPLVYT